MMQRCTALFDEQFGANCRQTDRMFAGLMAIQWLAGIIAALLISPKTWAGESSQTHLHVWVAVILGGLISGLPVLFALVFPGKVLTRHVIAVGQMLTSGLLVHLSGGRIETHFHYFGSLAFLAFYRDWRVLLTATIVAAADHFLRGLFWPQSIFGVLAASHWRWFEHACWVLFEDVFLVIAIRRNLHEMREVAERQARLETMNEVVEQKVGERTAELKAEIAERKQAEVKLAYERELLRSLLDNSPDQVYFKDAQSRFIKSGHAQAEVFGLQSAEELVGKSDFDFYPEEVARLNFQEELEIIRTGRPVIGKIQRQVANDGIVSWLLVSKMPLRNQAGEIIGTFGISKNITSIKETEAKLDDVHKQLLDASRQAGMAEVATNVLHNVGNVLNSVNVSTGVVADRLEKSKVTSLQKVVALLQENQHDLGGFFTKDPRGKQLPGYLGQLSTHLQGDRAATLKEIEALRTNVDHIKQIVSMQQNYAKVSAVKEIVAVHDLVEDSVRINLGSFERHSVEIVCEYGEVPAINIERHKVLQILVNLLRNAKIACSDSPRPDKKVIVRVTGDGEWIRISVIDNGVGIPSANLNRIFNHGFTTRKTGHGFGLHSGALAAKEMGGTLSVHSDGPGAGAAFTLELPCAVEQAFQQ